MTIKTNESSRLGLHRSAILAQRLRIAGLATLGGTTPEAVIDSLYPHMPKARRSEALQIFAANEVGPSEGTAGLGEGDSALLATLSAATLLGKLPMAWDLPMYAQTNGFATEVEAAEVLGAGEAIRIYEGDFTADFLTPVTAKAAQVVSGQLLRQPRTEDALGIRALRATAKAMDTEVITQCLNGSDPLPGGAAVPSELRARIVDATDTLMDAGADGAGICWVAHPKTCLRIGAYPGVLSGSEFDSVGINGGTLFQMPLIASRGATPGTLTAIASDAVARALRVPLIEASRSASIEMSSVPGASAIVGETPVGQTQRVVPMFQTDMVCLRVLADFGIAFGREIRAVQIADVLPEILTA